MPCSCAVAVFVLCAACGADGAAPSRLGRAILSPARAPRALARAAVSPQPPPANGPAEALRALAAGLALFVGAHFPGSKFVAFAEPPQQAAPALRPLEEAWDYADRYFLDRSFGGNDWKAVRARLVESAPADLPDDEVDRRAKEMYGLLGDKYSRALSRAEADELSKYDVTGINVNVMRRQSDGALVVSSVPPRGSESERSGVRFGDTVLAINGISMSGKSPFDALEVIQSKADDTVSIELRHADPDPTIPSGSKLGSKLGSGSGLEAGSGSGSGSDSRDYAVSLKRAFTASSPVVTRVVRVGGDGNGGRKGGYEIGYVKLSEFNAVGKRQVGQALRTMADRGVDGYVASRRGALAAPRPSLAPWSGQRHTAPAP